MSNIIVVNDINCSYGSKKVLCNVSITIKEKSIFFIMGNNGSGKTTLIKCLLNNINIQSGEIFIDGNIVSHISRGCFSKMVSYVSQNVNINCDFKVKDYLVLGRNPYIAFGNPTNTDYELVQFYAQRTGIEDILEQPFNSLSGGQKQWCAITRALVQETKIIVMDEPMAALDIGKQAELLMLLTELKEKEEKTIILTTHNPNHCFAVESIVCLLHNHKVYIIGTPDEVFSPENILEIYGEYVYLSNDNHIEFKTIKNKRESE